MKIINMISSVLCILLLILISFYTGKVANGFDGNIIFSTLIFSMLNPILNIFRIKKQLINNIVYHLFIWFFCLFNFYIYIKSFILLFKKGYNESTLYSSNFFIFNFLFCIFIYILSLFLKKDIKVGKRINHKKVYFLVMILSILPMLSDSTFVLTEIGYLNFFFAFYLLIKFNTILEKEKMQIIYGFIIFISLISLNFISFIIMMIMYKDLDRIFKIF